MTVSFVAGCGSRVASEGQESAPMDAVATDGGLTVEVDAVVPPTPDTAPATDTSPATDTRNDASPTNAVCIACINRNCTDDCHSDPICNKQSFCRQACIDDVCAQRCRDLYPSPLYDIWYQCLHDKCAAECGF